MKEEGFKFLRFLLLLSSLIPMFILLLIKGSDFENKEYNYIFSIVLCIFTLITVIPLLLRILIAGSETVHKKIDNIEPCCEEYSGYILSIVLPICQDRITGDNFWFQISLLSFIIFVFYVFNLYYLNIIFYLFGYKIHKVIPDNNAHGFIVISKRDPQCLKRTEIKTIRLTDSLFIEAEE